MSRPSTTFSKKAGLEVYLVNAREKKTLPGRKQCAEESQLAVMIVTADWGFSQ
jgi:hypothetical protein